MSERPELAAQHPPQEPVRETDRGGHPHGVGRNNDAVQGCGLARRGPHQRDHVGIAANDLVEGDDCRVLDRTLDLRKIALDASVACLVAAFDGGPPQHLEIGT
jgi:hypothetical protein